MRYEVTEAALEAGTKEQREAWALYLEHDGNVSEVARILGKDRTSITERIRRLHKKSLKIGQVAVPTSESETTGTSTLLDASGNVITQWVKTRKAGAEKKSSDQLVDEAMGKFRSSVEGKYKRSKVPKLDEEDILTVIPLGDPHIGMLSWGQETGADFDLDIATELYDAAISLLLSRTPRTGKVLLLNVGDYFHNNDQTNQTQRSKHILDVDGRFHRIINVGTAIHNRMIERCLEHFGTVDVWDLPGNHDGEAALWLAKNTSSYFRSEPRVNVNQVPGLHKQMVWGRNFIGGHHGHAANRNRLLNRYAVGPNRKLWGATDITHVYTGHFHQDRVLDTGLGVIEVVNTLTPKDAYAAGHCFLGQRTMKAPLWHKERGMICEGAKVNAAELGFSEVEVAA